MPLQGAHQYYEVELPDGAKGRLDVPHLADHPAGAPTAFALAIVHVQVHIASLHRQHLSLDGTQNPDAAHVGRTHDAVSTVCCFIVC